jgi:hypothetical protein
MGAEGRTQVEGQRDRQTQTLRLRETDVRGRETEIQGQRQTGTKR